MDLLSAAENWVILTKFKNGLNYVKNWEEMMTNSSTNFTEISTIKTKMIQKPPLSTT